MELCAYSAEMADYMTTRIIGTGSCLPARVVTNQELSSQVETSDEWITTRTGIRERRIAQEETTVSLAQGAAENALKQAGISAESLDLILVATSSPQDAFPNTASLVQHALGAVNAAGYDMSAACSGFILALHTADAFIQAGIYQNVLVIGVDVMSKLIDWTDRSTCVLFGDGAGAVLMSASQPTGGQAVAKRNMTCVMHNDGSLNGVLTCTERQTVNFLTNEKKLQHGFIAMDGQEVFRFAVKKVPQCILEVLEKSGQSKEEIDYFILHQANLRIIQSVAKRLGASEEKFHCNLQKYGNTSAASIPILLDEMHRDGRLRSGNKIVLSGFGAGLSWGAITFTW